MSLSFTWTNCGKVTYPQYLELCSTPPSIEGSKLPFFHSLLCEWATSLTPAHHWIAVIEPQNFEYLRQQIIDTVPNVFEPSKAQPWDVSSGFDNTFNDFTQSVIGCVFAMGYRSAEDGFSSEATTGNRGFLTSAITRARDIPHTFTLSFRETNSSFVDSVLKPWSILTAYKGLIARPLSESIKSTITIYEMANPYSSCEMSVIRKITTYYDCTPMKIASIDLNQDSLMTTHSVHFVFNTYTIKVL